MASPGNLRVIPSSAAPPAYRRFVNDDGPQSLADFDEWMLRTVLNPASSLFREARYLLEEAADVRDTAL